MLHNKNMYISKEYKDLIYLNRRRPFEGGDLEFIGFYFERFAESAGELFQQKRNYLISSNIVYDLSSYENEFGKQPLIAYHLIVLFSKIFNLSCTGVILCLFQRVTSKIKKLNSQFLHYEEWAFNYETSKTESDFISVA